MFHVIKFVLESVKESGYVAKYKRTGELSLARGHKNDF